MFTAATVTGIAAFLGGDLVMLIAGRLAPKGAVKAASALHRVLKIIDAHAEHLPPGVVRQIADEAHASGNAARESLITGRIRNSYGN